MTDQPQTAKKPESGATLKAFLTGAIIAASALAGGLAVVLWNRKALSGLRQHPDPDQKPSTEPDADEE
jgi:hypothetical protein